MKIISITHQGAPLVNVDSVIEKVCEDIAILTIDMRSKYCEILYCFSSSKCPAIGVCAGEYAIHLKEDVDEAESTDIELTKYKGWHIFVADMSRYTLRVCLVKDLS